MSSVFLVMLYGYPYMIFDDLDKAIRACKHYQKTSGNPGASLRIDEYEMDGLEKNNFVWSSWYQGKEKDKDTTK